MNASSALPRWLSRLLAITDELSPVLRIGNLAVAAALSLGPWPASLPDYSDLISFKPEKPQS